MLELKGDGTEERKGLELARSWLCLATFISLGQNGLVQKVRLFEKGGLPLLATLPGDHIHTCAVGKMVLIIATPGKSSVVKP